LEGVYQDALEVELAQREIPFSRERPIPITYKGHTLGTPYRADFVCYGSVIVELKAVKALTDAEAAQVLHYLKATGLERALLINFGTPRLDYKRFIQSENHLRPSAASAVHLQSGGEA
jgi:GxxExxY protein